MLEISFPSSPASESGGLPPRKALVAVAVVTRNSEIARWGVFIGVPSFILSFFAAQCPACGQEFYASYSVPAHCHKCGSPLTANAAAKSTGRSRQKPVE